MCDESERPFFCKLIIPIAACDAVSENFGAAFSLKLSVEIGVEDSQTIDRAPQRIDTYSRAINDARQCASYRNDVEARTRSIAGFKL